MTDQEYFAERDALFERIDRLQAQIVELNKRPVLKKSKWPASLKVSLFFFVLAVAVGTHELLTDRPPAIGLACLFLSTMMALDALKANP